MTPALFDLPLRLSDAVALAGVILNQPARVLNGPLTEEFRARIAARASGLQFEAMTPCLGSLERDPIHHSAWYVCADGVESAPLLLRMAPASTPSSGIFPKSILIGRTFVGSQELVFNAIPFGYRDQDRILKFSEEVNPAFQPKAAGSRPVVRVSGSAPGETFPAAFEGFRRLLRASGQNVAAFGLATDQDPADFYFATVWAAIRSGWREGYALHSDAAVPPIPGVRRRPFESTLTIAREIVLRSGMSREDILEQFEKI